MNHTESLSATELEEAFAVFSRVSNELDITYRELESKVAALTSELASARSSRLQELAEKERLAHRLSSLVAALPGAVIIVDAKGVVRDANPLANELLGMAIIGDAWSAVLGRASGSSESSEQLSPELLLSNGKHFSMSSRKLDSSGDQVVLITDVSEIHQLQEQLGRKKRLTALGEMAARLAHQIRTPLSSTTLYMAQLGRNDLSTDQRKNIASKVNLRLEHMGKLLDSMLSFVRGSEPTRENVDLEQVLREFKSTVTPQLVASGSTITVPTVDHTLSVVGDKDELVGALSNLAMNALEAGKGSVKLELWVCALNDDWLQIRFLDNGPGIAPDILERVFDPFFTTRAQGTGLGLAVVASTVADHGGEISVCNRPGGGAEFQLSLPIATSGSSAEETNDLRKTANE